MENENSNSSEVEKKLTQKRMNIILTHQQSIADDVNTLIPDDADLVAAYKTLSDAFGKLIEAEAKYLVGTALH